MSDAARLRLPDPLDFLDGLRAPHAVAPYPERREPSPNLVDRWAEARLGHVLARLPFRRRALMGRARRALRLDAEFRGMTDAALRAEAARLRAGLLATRMGEPHRSRAFALVREVSGRTLGKRHYAVQLAGAFGLLDGRLVEMATGEGKTLTAAPAAAVAALAGEPVHVVTVNDYLAGRDAEEVRPIFDFLGLSVGAVDSEMDETARRAAYACDVTYVSNKNLTFDYLRDRIAVGRRRGRGRRLAGELAGGRRGGPLMLRGLAFAIVDEADSVLVDEARTPLILSATADDPEAARLYAEGLAVARALREGRHFRIDRMNRHVELTEAGKAALAEAAAGLSGLWSIRKAREELCAQALSALHLFALGRDYIVVEDAVQIVDEFTGRTMPDRSWQGGLHQMIEAKEGLPITGRKETLARITYQRFFARYRRLAGMTGTGLELAGEIYGTYGLATVRIPTHRPLRRRWLGVRAARSEAAKWQAVARRAEALAATGRPVLIGARSVEASERISAALQGRAHVVLNARREAEEAAIVAEAGQPGRVTVATNMAGRGTDIRLGPGVAERGGLHVILTEFHESARIDRQLFGRAGRQGDPGSAEAIVSLEDELFVRFAPLLRRLSLALPGPLAARLLRAAAQSRAEAEHAATRRDQTELDRKLERALGFAGPPE